MRRRNRLEGEDSRILRFSNKPKWKTNFSMICENFLVTDAHETVLDSCDLFRITSHVDDIQDFHTRWDQALLSTSEVPNNKILENLYKMREQESDQLQTVLVVYEQEITQDRSRPGCQELKTMVKRHIDQDRLLT